MGTLLVSSAYAAGAACDDKLTASLHECERIVGSLRPDKAGQMRVFASDGSEFTAGQAQWMKGQLQLIAKACAEGDAADASRHLAEVRELLNEHHHGA
ncbi:MAG: hypothetical protein ABSF31_08630 [Steroidobacteraceae bacterium]